MFKKLKSPKWLAQLALIGTVYFAAGKLGLSLAIVNPSASAVWPPAGIALTALLLFGMDVWPALFIAAFFVNLTTAGTLITSMGIAAGNTFEGVLGAYLVKRYASGIHAFERSYDVFKFVALAALLSTAVSATLGVTILAVSGLAPWSKYLPIWLTWWQGDAIGDILVAPFLILWAAQPRLHWTRRQYFEAPLVILTLCLLALAGFCGWYASPTLAYTLRIFCIPVVIWAAFRFGAREAATSSVILGGMAIWGTLQGRGPFGQERFPNDALLRLQMFIGVVTIIGISVGVEVWERKRSARALIHANEQLETRVNERTASLSAAIKALQGQIFARSNAEERFQRILDSNIIGFMIVDMQGKVLEANDAFLDAMGYSRQDLTDGRVGGQGMTAPGYQAMDEWVQVRLKNTGYCPPFEKEYIRRDGSRWPVLVGVVRLDTPEPHCVCFVIDATERRKAQTALQQAYDEMEVRVQQRTAELQQEIMRREHAEEELRNQAIQDTLTGLYNRRGFVTLSEKHLQLARRQKKPLLLFMGDLDDLKQINDQFGHGEGDYALAQAGELLRKTFRQSDIQARIGGDEFAVAGVEDDANTERNLLERLEKNLNDYNRYSGKAYRLHLSVGTARIDPSSTKPLEQCMQQADEKLYEQKRRKEPTILKSPTA